MIFMDPPYNVAVADKFKVLNDKGFFKNDYKPIIADQGMTDEECGERLWRPAFKNLYDNAADHCVYYMTMPQGGTHMMMMMMMMKECWQVKHELMWLKPSPVFSFGRLDYDGRHEPILYGWKKKHRFFGKGKFKTTVWEFAPGLTKKLHPTMKPVKLIINALLNSSLEGEIVADTFAGSGSTLIACEKIKRVCRAMEIEPDYCDIIRRRWCALVHGDDNGWEEKTEEVKS